MLLRSFVKLLYGWYQFHVHAFTLQKNEYQWLFDETYLQITTTFSNENHLEHIRMYVIHIKYKGSCPILHCKSCPFLFQISSKGCEVRSFPFDRFPDYIKQNIQTISWKPLLIQVYIHGIHPWLSILWCSRY